MSFLTRWLAPEKRGTPPPTIAGMPIPAAHLADLRPQDVLLVSYPRSGNTWVRYLLYELILAENPELPPPAHIDLLLPDLHMHAPGGEVQQGFGLKGRILKSHNLRDIGARSVIYIFRQPADALISYFHLQRDLAPQKGAEKLTPDEFCRRGANGWAEHARLALARAEDAPERSLLISYSMLHRDTAGALRRMAEFSKVPCHDATLIRAVERAAFERLRKTAVPSRPTGNSEKFFRQGKEDSAAGELSSETLAEIEAETGEIYRGLEARAATAS